MSKRFSHFQPNSFASKKPKLDISFGRRDVAGPSNSFGRRDVAGPSNAKPRHTPKHTNAFDITSESLFDDADDDVILLASQHVEADNQQDKFSQQILFNESVTEISFSNFGREIPTSTQVIITSREKPSNDAFDNIEKYFEDEIEIQMKDFDVKENFKVPKPVPKPTPQPSTSKSSTNDLENRKTTKERDGLMSQVNYLTEKTALFKEQIEKLTKDASDFNDKIQTKDGEVSLVRHQLRQVQHQNEKLCLEKMQEIDNIKKEWQEKIAELERVVKSQQGELEFKNVEIVNLKSSKMNDTQRFVDNVEKKKDFKTVPFVLNLHLDLNETEDQACDMPAELFKKKLNSDEKLKFRDAVFQRELDAVQSGLSEMSVTKREGVENSSIDLQIITCLKESVKMLLQYARTLEYMKYIETNASVEYKFLCEEFRESPTCPIHDPQRSIYHEAKLYPTEKAEIPRRLFGAYAIACKYSPSVCKSLLTEKIGNSTLFEVLIQVISFIGFSKEVFSHFGLLESLQVLLLNFLENETDIGENAQLVSQYIRELVFCRPTYRPLVQISKCLLYIATNSNYASVLNSLCTNSPLGSFVFNDYYKIFQFSPKSCVLQVYAALLETAFPQDVVLGKAQLNCLLQLCSNHIQFLHISLETNAKWILTSDGSSMNCDCYVKAVNSFVILFHSVLKQWILDPKGLDNRIVSEIARCGVLLLYETFNKNYRRDILTNGGSPVKNRLHMIHNWLVEYKSVFHFKTAHYNALQSIKLSHIIADPIRMDDASVGESIPEGDEIWNQVFDNFF